MLLELRDNWWYLVVLLHVFQEDDQDQMAGHLEHWFGQPEAGGHGWPAVCFCGASVIMLARDSKAPGGAVGAVWHYDIWRNDVTEGL